MMSGHRLLHEYLHSAAAMHPEKTALVCGGRRWTYGFIEEQAGRLARAMADAGTGRQDRVIILLENSVETVIAMFGILKLGAVMVPLNHHMRAAKLEYIIRDSGARLLVTHLDKADMIAGFSPACREQLRFVWVGGSAGIPDSLAPLSTRWQDATAMGGAGCGFPSLNRSIDYDLAALIYTSGSTGEPKGVMSSHHNMISAAKSIIQYLGSTADDIVLDLLPLSFDYGLYQVLMAFMSCGTVVLEKSFSYPIKTLELIEKEHVTGFPVMPTILALLFGALELGRYDLGSLRYMTNTGAALPVEHIRRLRGVLPWVKFYSMFGLTECKRVSYLPPEELDRRPLSVGKAMPNCEVFIVDEKGAEVPPGTAGELVVRGANVMRGYWNDREATARTFRDTGSGEAVLFSGDYFRRDEEGYLYFIGRKDDIIKTKGERVSPRELENALCGMEGVAEAAVMGVPDDILGQAIAAFIATAEGAALSRKSVLKYCRETLEPWMVPKYLEISTSLPKSPNGKVDREELRKRLLAMADIPAPLRRR
ncbi:MAG: AMP-binding protein [Nitrospiraceae bacterium]|nr:AMP-binding protein [Nitrospiraceae bacterium]